MRELSLPLFYPDLSLEESLCMPHAIEGALEGRKELPSEQLHMHSTGWSPQSPGLRQNWLRDGHVVMLL
jgi:hypothetical protein